MSELSFPALRLLFWLSAALMVVGAWSFHPGAAVTIVGYGLLRWSATKMVMQATRRAAHARDLEAQAAAGATSPEAETEVRH